MLSSLRREEKEGERKRGKQRKSRITEKKSRAVVDLATTPKWQENCVSFKAFSTPAANELTAGVFLAGNTSNESTSARTKRDFAKLIGGEIGARRPALSSVALRGARLRAPVTSRGSVSPVAPPLRPSDIGIPTAC
ncbi:hypothetical protein EVAR_32767_1 [Eumeta japonica]|uniref:Uncharacterized protein n=1 Tax=Eumeta variegata TaxID=151549 RepID=A0A4C1WE96_EUMVA|nr:hypothetical protein EVAR_32767_1 [Eumeta japonica]